MTSEKKQAGKESASSSELSDEVIYKIEIPANRYDLLCMEGLVDALRVFLGKMPAPKMRVVPGPLKMHVAPEVGAVRPFVACAVLRGIKFTQASYDSFIDLQDKLHNGLGRNRTLVSMGTHDLDKVSGVELSYAAKRPEEIRFRPLNQATEVDGHGLMRLYETDNKIKRFLPIIRDAPKYPVILDASGNVLSLPPLINSDRSKISLATRNVFIEVTGTDAAKVGIGLNMVVAAFSRYCEKQPYTVESVEVVLADGSRVATPDLSERLETVPMAYIRRLTGLPLSAAEACRLLARMMVEASPDAAADSILVRVPAVRSDILHACDIMEDVAIAYGFNNIPKLVPTTAGFGAPLPINKLSDMLRREVALAGFSEVLTFTLCSHAENFAKLRRSDDGSEAVIVGNPKTSDFEVVQTSLIPQTLKTLSSNKKMALPIKIFQVLDVVLKTDTNDVGARNERRLCAAYCNQSSDLEVIHGLLDRVMLMLDVKPDAAAGYSIRESALPTFFEGRQAEVLYKGVPIGAFGIVHPLVSQAFEAPYVTSLLELNIEPFL